MSSLAFTSCGGDDVDCSDEDALFATIEDELNAVFDATLSYSLSATDENCQTLVNAISAYLDEARNLQSCADQIGEGEQFRSDIDQAEADLAQLPC